MRRARRPAVGTAALGAVTGAATIGGGVLPPAGPVRFTWAGPAKAAEVAAVGDPEEPITVARALLKQAASTVDLADRLALVIEARQWAALDR